jgi:hypothetical protein
MERLGEVRRQREDTRKRGSRHRIAANEKRIKDKTKSRQERITDNMKRVASRIPVKWEAK